MDNHKNLDIPGYIHPENFNNNSGKIYKTFTEGKKPKKNEKFKNTILSPNYLIVKNNSSKCPICNEIFVKICNCNFNDKKCKNNHTWYTDRKGNIKIGNPHK